MKAEHQSKEHARDKFQRPYGNQSVPVRTGQNNHSHARELYERIIQTDPDSDLAKKAKERLAALQKKEQR